MGGGGIIWKPFKSYYQVDLYFSLLMLQQVKTGSRYSSSLVFSSASIAIWLFRGFVIWASL